jgi:hypothetical protein
MELELGKEKRRKERGKEEKRKGRRKKGGRGWEPTRWKRKTIKEEEFFSLLFTYLRRIEIGSLHQVHVE